MISIEESIIVLSWNGLPYISKCLSAICSQISRHSEIILVDNGSSDGTVPFVCSHFPSVRVIENASNMGVSNGWNIGINHSKGKLIYFINQDVYLKDGWLNEMRNAMKCNEKIGIAGCKLLYPGERIIQHAGGRINFPQFLTTHIGLGELDIGLYDKENEVDYVTGAAFCVKNAVFKKIGTFDPIFFPAYCEDLDFCLRARFSGFKVMYIPNAIAIHHHSSSLGRDSYSKYYYKHTNRLRLIYKHLREEQISDFFRSEIKWLLASNFSENEVVALSDIYPDFFHSKSEHRIRWLQKLLLIYFARYRTLKFRNLPKNNNGSSI